MNGRFYKNPSSLVGKLADVAHEDSTLEYYKRLETEKADKVIFYDIFNEKFAELIIKECADIVKKDMDYNANWCDDKILKHFGVSND
jgi:hypothetical protein